MDGEHVNQASKGQHPEHQPLRRGQQELTSCSSSLFPCPGQGPQAAAVDEFQACQVDDDVRVSGHKSTRAGARVTFLEAWLTAPPARRFSTDPLPGSGAAVTAGYGFGDAGAPA